MNPKKRTTMGPQGIGIIGPSIPLLGSGGKVGKCMTLWRLGFGVLEYVVGLYTLSELRSSGQATQERRSLIVDRESY